MSNQNWQLKAGDQFAPQIDGYPLWSGLPPPERIDANALEKMAKERPDECFLKGSGILKLIGAIRQLESEIRAIADNAPFSPDWANYLQGLADGKADAIEALQAARPYIVSQNNAEGMMKGFGGRKSRPSDADLAMIDAAIAAIQSTDAENASKKAGEIDRMPPPERVELGDAGILMASANIVEKNQGSRKDIVETLRDIAAGLPITQPLIAEAARDDSAISEKEAQLKRRPNPAHGTPMPKNHKPFA